MDAAYSDFYFFRETRVPNGCPDFDALAVLYHDTREERYLAWMLNLYETRMNSIAIGAAIHYDMYGYFSDFKDCVVQGIYRALRQFDPEKGVYFSTFMVNYLKDEIHALVRTLRRGFSGMRKSTDEKFRKTMAAYNWLGHPQDQKSMEQIAAEVGISVKVVREILLCARQYTELIWCDKGKNGSNADEEDQNNLKHEIPTPGGSAETEFFRQQRTEELWEAFDALTEQEQEMLAAYLGFCPVCGSGFRMDNGKRIPYRPMFLADIAAIHQMYEPRTAKKVIDRALDKMRKHLLASGWFAPE